MYKALYRKYRPKTFDEICGQEAVVTSLKNQVKNNEISHAYIFQGTRGTGKTSAAKILSRAVNCLHPVDGNPCNECENCKSILNESSLDVVEMDAASNNGVDDIRELKEKVIYPPQSLKYKVYIIDEVHMLSKGAFNALLKILEEPPRHLIFILATTEIEKIPATILSRSQKYNFKRISIEKISENLKKIAELEGKSCDDEVFTLIAKSSDGAMRDALSVLDQLLTKNKNHIKLEDAMEVLGISSSELLFNLSRALIEKNVNESLLAIDEIYKEGVDFNTLSSQILNHFRDLLMVKTLKDPKKIVYSTFLKEFQEIAGR
ncbi:MAG: DNA polymerase III subunit gamma/tau, partial [Peptoniphilus harei]|nr:DNA polymerase III subunit gamma/tau [Peptoniphilus harei]